MTSLPHARAWTPALMLHLTNPCAKRKVLSLTKPKGKIYKTKSLGHYITHIDDLIRMNKKNLQSNIYWHFITQKNTKQRSRIWSNVLAKFNLIINECQGFCECTPFACLLVCLPELIKPVCLGWQKWLFICILYPHIKLTHTLKQFCFKVWVKISFPVLIFCSNEPKHIWLIFSPEIQKHLLHPVRSETTPGFDKKIHAWEN